MENHFFSIVLNIFCVVHSVLALPRVDQLMLDILMRLSLSSLEPVNCVRQWSNGQVLKALQSARAEKTIYFHFFTNVWSLPKLVCFVFVCFLKKEIMTQPCLVRVQIYSKSYLFILLCQVTKAQWQYFLFSIVARIDHLMLVAVCCLCQQGCSVYM